MVTRGEYLEFDRGDPHSCIKIIPSDWTEEDFNKVVEAYEIGLKLYSEKNTSPEHSSAVAFPPHIPHSSTSTKQFPSQS